MAAKSSPVAHPFLCSIIQVRIIHAFLAGSSHSQLPSLVRWEPSARTVPPVMAFGPRRSFLPSVMMNSAQPTFARMNVLGLCGFQDRRHIGKLQRLLWQKVSWTLSGACLAHCLSHIFQSQLTTCAFVPGRHGLQF